MTTDLQVHDRAPKPDYVPYLALSIVILSVMWGCAKDNRDVEISDGGLPDASSFQIDCDECLVFTGAFFDGAMMSYGAVVVREGKIEAVHHGTDFEIVSGEVKVLEGETLLPGLFDLHVHISASGGPYGYFPTALQTEDLLRATLRNGVTTILDLGTRETIAFEFRRRQREGWLLGPRIYAAGPLFTPSGGHPCYAGAPARGCRLVDSVEDVEHEMADLLAKEPDVIKVVIEAGTPSRPLPFISQDVLEGITSRTSTVPLIAHISSSSDIAAALDAGISVFAHIPGADLLSSDLVERLRQAEAIFVPTLAVLEGLVNLADGKTPADEELLADVPTETIASLHNPLYLHEVQTPGYLAWARAMLETAQTNFAHLHQAGITILAGSDSGNPLTFHGRSLARELALYVENGMSAQDALVAATSASALFLGIDGGRIEPGQPADLIVVGGDPFEDISVLTDTRAVYYAGIELDLKSLDVREDTALIQQPVTDRLPGDVCFSDMECSADLNCAAWDYICTPACDPAHYDCPGGVCWQSLGDGGYCEPGSDCDLLAQDCPNEAPCVFLGNGATYCYFTGPGRQGDPCAFGNTCAKGFQCSFQTGRCAQLCDPSLDFPGCPGTTQCVDMTSMAGVIIGLCV